MSVKKTAAIVQVKSHIYKKTHRSGAATWIVRWKSPKTGRWKTSAGGQTEDEARVIEGRIRAALLKDEDPTFVKDMIDGDLTVAQVIERFLAHSRFLGASEGWRLENKTRIDRYLLPQLGGERFLDLTSDRVLKHYISIRDQGLSRATIHKVHTLFCLIADLYQELRPDAENAPRKVKFGKFFPKRAPKREINFLTPEELEKLFRACARAHHKLLLPLVKFLAYTGMRRGEALNLKWTDIDRESGFFHVRQSKTGRARIIPIEPEALAAVEPLQGHSEFVFAYADGVRPDKTAFRKSLLSAAKKAGITKRIDLHTLRHSYGSNKIRAGWGLKKVSMLLGHSDISMTANIYTHLLDGDLRLPDQDRAVSGTPARPAGDGHHDLASRVLAEILERALSSMSFGAEALKAISVELEKAARTASEGIKLTEILKNSKTGTDVPHLLRKPGSSEKTSEPSDSSQSAFQSLIEKLESFENGRGNWIRTSDLFVPKNQSKAKLSGRKYMEAAHKNVEFELQKQAKIDRKMQIILRIAEIACPAYAPQTSAGLASTAPSPERRAK